jgi:preprotein translocase subunit SecD
MGYNENIIMKKFILLLVAILVVGTAFAQNARSTFSGTSSTFQIRRVVDSPTEDSEVMTITDHLANNAIHTIDLNVERTILIDQTALKSAKEVNHNIKEVTGQELKIPVIEISFSAAGRKDFARVTGENLGRKLAIIINGRVWCAPTIRAAITGGKAEITGSFSEAEAKALATDLNAACSK